MPSQRGRVKWINLAILAKYRFFIVRTINKYFVPPSSSMSAVIDEQQYFGSKPSRSGDEDGLLCLPPV
jgi:hypothetical protein